MAKGCKEERSDDEETSTSLIGPLVLVVAADIFSRGTWTYVRRLPEHGVPLSQRLAQKPARVT